jgi:uncharacterized membrane protein
MPENPEYYKWGIFYFNPNDRRIFVPKAIKYFGYTLNFGNPYSYLVLIGTVLIIICLTIFFK